MICNNLGPGISLRSFKVSTNLVILCPSIGPKYLIFIDSNRLLLLLINPLMLCSNLLAISLEKLPPTGSLPRVFQISSLILLYVCEVVMSVRYSRNDPTFGSMLMLLSFKITSKSASATPAWFMASKAIPAVMEPSPIIATAFLSNSPLCLAAIAIPNAADMEVEECPTPNASYSLSLLFGKPLSPPYFLLVGKLSLLPVSIL